MGRNRFSAVVGLSVLLPGVQDTLAQSAACATIANMGSDKWTSPSGNGTWTLSQDGSGNIFGSATAATVPATCPQTVPFSASGKVNVDGSFSLRAMLDHPVTGCVSFRVTGTISGPGCDRVLNATWVNDDGSSGTGSWQHGCYSPTGETTPQLLGWGVPASSGTAGDPTIATFIQYLVTANYNWGGRTLMESSPSPGTDTCWYQGNPLNIPAHTTVSGNSITLRGSDITGAGSPYKDDIGPTQVLATYWRLLKRVPCGSTVSQAMTLKCDGTVPPYITNTDSNGIDSTQVKSSRAGELVTRRWAPSIDVTAIVNKLLLNAGH